MTVAACHPLDSDEQDATRLLLRRLFWRASTPLVAGLLVGGCVESEAPLLEESSEALIGPSLHCDARDQWRPMSALQLTEPVDFIALRRTGAGFVPLDAAGVPCATAAAPRVCEAELARVSLLEARSPQPHFAITQDDTVRALVTLEEKLALLGAIDTPDEALLIAQHHGVPVSCQALPLLGAQTQVRVRDKGYTILTQQSVGCNVWRRSFFEVDTDGTFRLGDTLPVSGPPCSAPSGSPSGGPGPGRRPANLRALHDVLTPASRLARYFARAAALEAASVPAFEQLAAELRVLGAPSALRQAALRAAEDEVRHARITAALAEQLGARPRAPELGRTRLRSRDEVALDNALEGCVYETYSAYLATAQARLARGTALASPLTDIAHDETAHSALSWQIAAWLEPQLAPSVGKRVAAARNRAIRAL